MGRTGNRRLKQRTCHSLFYSLKRLVVSSSMSDTDVSNALVDHNGLDIRKIKVDQRRYIDEICNALDTLLKNFVRLFQSVRHRCSSVNDLKKLIIRNDNQCVYIFF